MDWARQCYLSLFLPQTWDCVVTWLEKLVAGIHQQLKLDITSEDVKEVFPDDIPDELSKYNDKVAKHISGHVSTKIIEETTCEDCKKAFPKSRAFADS